MGTVGKVPRRSQYRFRRVDHSFVSLSPPSPHPQKIKFKKSEQLRPVWVCEGGWEGQALQCPLPSEHRRCPLSTPQGSWVCPPLHPSQSRLTLQGPGGKSPTTVPTSGDTPLPPFAMCLRVPRTSSLPHAAWKSPLEKKNHSLAMGLPIALPSSPAATAMCWGSCWPADGASPSCLLDWVQCQLEGSD